jgi:hypothetical protein
MNQYYRVDIRNLGFRELWRISPGRGFLVGCAAKILRFPLAMKTRVPCQMEMTVLEPGQVPEEIRQAWATPLSDFQRLGFREAFAYTIPPVSPGMRGFSQTFLSPDGTVAGQIMVVEVHRDAFHRREVLWQCLSAFGDGTISGTTSQRKKMDSPPEFEGLNLPGIGVEELVSRHRERVLSSPHGKPVPLSLESLKALIIRLTDRAAQFHAARGVYVPE